MYKRKRKRPLMVGHNGQSDEPENHLAMACLMGDYLEAAEVETHPLVAAHPGRRLTGGKQR